MSKKHRSALFRLVVFELLVVSVFPLSAQQIETAVNWVDGTKIVECGDELDRPGRYRLSENLTCPVGVPPVFFCETAAITVTSSNVELDGGGFTLSGDIFTGVGIRVMAKNVYIHDITVEAFNNGIEMTGGGAHRLSGVTVRRNNINEHCNGGVGLQLINANYNVVDNSTISNNASWGVRLIESHGNRFLDNDISHNSFRPGDLSGNIDLLSSNSNKINGNDLSRGGQFGVRGVNSHGNLIQANVLDETATPAPFGVAIFLAISVGNVVQGNHIDRAPTSFSYRGIVLIDSSRNILARNAVFHHPEGGIVLSEGATRNVIFANVASENTPWDAQDDNPDCDSNFWKANQFGTVNQSCID